MPCWPWLLLLLLLRALSTLDGDALGSTMNMKMAVTTPPNSSTSLQQGGDYSGTGVHCLPAAHLPHGPISTRQAPALWSPHNLPEMGERCQRP